MFYFWFCSKMAIDSTTLALLIAGGVGVAVGLIVSVVFGVYSKATSQYYVRTLFGISSEELLETLIVSILAASVIGLAGISVMIRDFAYPTAKPLEFTTEVLLFGILPAAVFLLMSVFRGYGITKDTILEFVLLAAKFGILHVLLQGCGFYSNVFPYPPSK
jgi:hypothetical protein